MFNLIRSLLIVLIGLVATGCTLSSKRASLNNDPLSAPKDEQALVFQVQNDFGSALTSSEKKKITETELRTLEYGVVGEAVKWKGDGPSVSGVITAFQPFRVGQSNCRRFKHTLSVKNKSQEAKGTACRQGTGAWRLIK